MKKLLATVLAVVLAMAMILGTVCAAEEELPRNDDGNAQITDQITAAPAGSKLIVTVKYDPDSEGGTKSGTADAGWGIGGIGTAGWDVDADFGATCADKPSFGDELTFTYDVDAIKAAATGDITVNFYNGFLVTKIVLQTPDAPKTEDPKTEDPKDDTPKTADTMTVVLFAGVAILALGAVVVTKKARA